MADAIDVPRSDDSPLQGWGPEPLGALEMRLWGPQARLVFLLGAAAAMLLVMLGAREPWTLEARWADICWRMIHSGDYVHPNHGGVTYYDKPLLSYWLMVVTAHFVGLSVWALRLPSVLAGLLALWCTFDVGCRLIGRRTAFLAGWMLVTTHFFVFWARTAAADMLNLAGIMAAMAWYVRRRDTPGFRTAAVFFLIVAVTCLFKGLVAAAVSVLAIAPHLLRDGCWRRYRWWPALLAMLPAALVYFIPFWASTQFGSATAADATASAGLYQVYRENVLRYFAPFDHTGPIYTYVLYGPVYMLPWTLVLAPALWTLPRRWRSAPDGVRWLAWSTLIIFLFFTLSGSRRSYYVLPLVPFGTLLMAEWLTGVMARQPRRSRQLAMAVAAAYGLLFVAANVAVGLYYSGGGAASFGRDLRARATAIRPWSSWKIISLDARDKLVLYVDPAHPIEMVGAPGGNPDTPAAGDILAAWPAVAQHHPDTILITREHYAARLASHLDGYRQVHTPPSWGPRLLRQSNADDAVALIPVSP